MKKQNLSRKKFSKRVSKNLRKLSKKSRKVGRKVGGRRIKQKKSIRKNKKKKISNKKYKLKKTLIGGADAFYNLHPVNPGDSFTINPNIFVNIRDFFNRPYTRGAGKDGASSINELLYLLNPALQRPILQNNSRECNEISNSVNKCYYIACHGGRFNPGNMPSQGTEIVTVGLDKYVTLINYNLPYICRLAANGGTNLLAHIGSSVAINPEDLLTGAHSEDAYRTCFKDEIPNVQLGTYSEGEKGIATNFGMYPKLTEILHRGGLYGTLPQAFGGIYIMEYVHFDHVTTGPTNSLMASNSKKTGNLPLTIRLTFVRDIINNEYLYHVIQGLPPLDATGKKHIVLSACMKDPEQQQQQPQIDQPVLEPLDFGDAMGVDNQPNQLPPLDLDLDDMGTGMGVDNQPNQPNQPNQLPDLDNLEW
jgi:hypothetical protein